MQEMNSTPDCNKPKEYHNKSDGDRKEHIVYEIDIKKLEWDARDAS